MSQTKVYKNAKAEKAIRESYDALLKMWGTDIEERDFPGQYGTTHVIKGVCMAGVPVKTSGSGKMVR